MTSRVVGKRRRADIREDLSTLGLTRAFEEAIETKPNAEMVVLHLIDRYNFDLNELLTKIAERGLDVCFSKVTYIAIAPLVGLDPTNCLRDATTFDIHRARVPTTLFKDIISDMHLALNQYGPPQDHQTEEARSRYLAPLMNRIVAQFSLLITNSPECIMPGRLTTKGRIEYQFKVCGALTVLFVEVKYKLASGTDRLNAVAQVIAEADACDFMNYKVNFNGPIYAVLCDGDSFEFYNFDGRSRPPTFARGIIQHPTHQAAKLTVPAFENSTPKSYIKALRPICETMHNLFLTGYLAGLNAYHERSLLKAVQTGKARESTPAWVAAITLAEEALSTGQMAADVALAGDIASANLLAVDAFAALKQRESLLAAPAGYRRDDCDLESGWDEDDCD